LANSQVSGPFVVSGSRRCWSRGSWSKCSRWSGDGAVRSKPGQGVSAPALLEADSGVV